MSPPFQVASLVSAPSFPNSIVWSEENLIAVATGDFVTILNPEQPHAPRGVVRVTAGEPPPIGVIDRKDLSSGCLLPICLSRNNQPCARSISWSPVGLASNFGCLLAVCTTEGRVKIYRQPYCEFQAEWIEVVDISNLLHNYVAKVNYGEPEIPCSSLPDSSAIQISAENPVTGKVKSPSRMEHMRKRAKDLDVSNDLVCAENEDDKSADSVHAENTITAAAETATSPSSVIQEGSPVEVVGKEKNNNLLEIIPCMQDTRKTNKRTPEKYAHPCITAHQYASRSALLASLVVAWSPVLQLSGTATDDSCNCFSLLAVGAKSGRVSIWRIHGPPYYSIEHDVPVSTTLSALIHAHNAWVTALSWGVLATDASNPRFLLATGGSDGSVKIWQGCGEDLRKSLEAEPAPLCLWKEVTVGGSVAASVISLIVPMKSPHKTQIAIGRVCGSFEAWTFNLEHNSLRKIGDYDAHDHVVTGLVWALDGRYLYSCSEDNSMRGWMFHKGSLSEVSIPANHLSIRNSSDLSHAFCSCFGVTTSPGNLAMAVVRCFDPEKLDQMYEKSTQKAAVEFFWIGGQKPESSSNIDLEFDVKPSSGFSDEELVCWGSNLLWSLNKFECHRRHLMIWDIVAASSAFKHREPKYIEHILIKWVSLSFKGHMELSTRDNLSRVPRYMSNISSRQLQLLNILCRRIIMSKSDKRNARKRNLAESYGAKEEQLWMELMQGSEKELRERLVGFCLSIALSVMSHSPYRETVVGNWKPEGIGQMLRWIRLNHDNVRRELSVLASEVGKLASGNGLHTLSQYESEERCSLCSAAVPFESLEFASCQGTNCEVRAAQRHKLARCAVSMQVCPLTPTWFCSCCQRRVSKLPPHYLFTMPSYPQDFKSYLKSLNENIYPKPLCPFCGIQLQRLQPDFLLSTCPV